jgi:hypothetical protein
MDDMINPCQKCVCILPFRGHSCKELPEFGEICFFHDDPVEEFAHINADFVCVVAPFVNYNEKEKWYSTAKNDFKYCTRLGETLK